MDACKWLFQLDGERMR